MSFNNGQDHDACVYDLPLFRTKALFLQVPVKDFKQLLHNPGFDKSLAESPDGCGVWRFLAGFKPDETAKRKPIINNVLGIALEDGYQKPGEKK